MRPGMTRDLPAMRAVGYRQVWDYLEGLTDWQAMNERAVAATRQLARRQLTWLRSESDVVRFDSLRDGLFSDVMALLGTRFP